jgi:hypothetical protein
MDKEIKTYSIRTAKFNIKTGKKYEQEIGKIIHNDGSIYLDLYMFPDTKFRIVEDIIN